jgi:superfamily II DNA or RNA helicase
MCQMLAAPDGTQAPEYCNDHTKIAYAAFMAEQSKGPAGAFGSSSRKSSRAKFSITDAFGNKANAIAVVRAHASHGTGFNAVARDIKNLTESKFDTDLVKFLALNSKRGTIVKSEKAAVKKAIEPNHNQKNILAPMKEATDTYNVRAYAESNFPDGITIDMIWDPAKNNGVWPEQITPGACRDFTYTHPHCHHDNEGVRVGNAIPTIAKGKIPGCRQCKPQPEFARAQENLTDLVAALGNNAAAFDALSGAAKADVLAALGLLGSAGSMSRTIGMSVVHGDLTLAEVFSAANYAKVADRLHHTGDVEDTVSTKTGTSHVDSQATTTDLDDLLTAAGVLDLLSPSSSVAERVLVESVDNMWLWAVDIDDLGSQIDLIRGLAAQAKATSGRTTVINRFLAEFEAVISTPLPDGYTALRVDGSVKNPMLAQMRFVHEATTKRRLLNLSEPGFGKTLACVLAIASDQAASQPRGETLVVCPFPVISQWVNEFESAFPGKFEVRTEMPYDLAPSDKPRVWVINYDQFQKTAAEQRTLKASLTPFLERLDAVILDEAHLVMKHDDSTTTVSTRYRVISWALNDIASKANSDLMVIGATATPTVNNLSETKSVIDLVSGSASGLQTAPTVSNAIAAHHRMRAMSVRHATKHGVNLHKHHETVDITRDVSNIVATVRRGAKGAIHPSKMERGLLPAKIPALIKAVARANGPVLVYTEYVEGMVAPIRDALTAAGYRVAAFTGQESDTDRATILAAFKSGTIDVLVGSKPIATGVDGLQAVCSNLIVVCAPWTAALLDQLIGRLLRPGQTSDVNVTYILTEATISSGKQKTVVSYCRDERLARIEFKRTLADAVTTGVIPEGIVDGASSAGVEKALAALAA